MTDRTLTSKEQLQDHMAVVLWRSLNRLHLAVKECARIGFEESSPTTNPAHFDIWNNLNAAQADAALKLKHFSTGLSAQPERPFAWYRPANGMLALGDWPPPEPEDAVWQPLYLSPEGRPAPETCERPRQLRP